MPSFVPSIESVLRRAVDLFRSEFESDPEVAGFAPGRVNLIGEHTDYNDGLVLPMALSMITMVVGRQNNTNDHRIYTSTDDSDQPHKIRFPADQELKPGKPKWANYVKGVIANFKEGPVPGFDAVIVSSVPVGGGVSSSAALEVATYTFLESLVGCRTASLVNKALACQKAEHDFAGMPCGIMDQFVSVMAQEGSALLIDCKSLKSTLVPVDDPDIIILLTNSNVKHELTGSEYSSRKAQCIKAAKMLGVKSLREATVEDLEVLEANGADKEVIARARHVITEIRRTEEAAEALRDRDFEKFGQLMIDSHISLRDDFQVSCPELDELVEAALEVNGVLGSRMTGGGFGGCTVTLVRKESLNDCVNNIKNKYSGDPIFYTSKPSTGAKIITINANYKH